MSSVLTRNLYHHVSFATSSSFGLGNNRQRNRRSHYCVRLPCLSPPYHLTPTSWSPITKNFLQIPENTGAYKIFPTTLTLPTTITPTAVITQTASIDGHKLYDRILWPPLLLINNYYAHADVPVSLATLATSIFIEKTTFTRTEYYSLYRPTPPAFCTGSLKTTWTITATTLVGGIHDTRIGPEVTPHAVSTFGPVKHEDTTRQASGWSTYSIAYLLTENALPTPTETHENWYAGAPRGSKPTITTSVDSKARAAACAEPTGRVTDKEGNDWAASITSGYISPLPLSERIRLSAVASASAAARVREEKEREAEEEEEERKKEKNKKLGLGLGIGLGVPALILLGFVIWRMRRYGGKNGGKETKELR